MRNYIKDNFGRISGRQARRNWRQLSRRPNALLLQTALLTQSLARSFHKNVDWFINPRDLNVYRFDEARSQRIFTLYNTAMEELQRGLNVNEAEALARALRQASILALG